MAQEKEQMHRSFLEWNHAPETKQETLQLLRESPILYNSYRKWNNDWKGFRRL